MAVRGTHLTQEPEPRISLRGEEGTRMINLYINERRAGEVTVLDLKGRVRIGGSAAALHQSIRCLVGEGKTQILLDLTGVTHIDSSGLGELIASRITLSNKGGVIKLINLTERLRDLMTISKLLMVFDAYDNESEALASFPGEVVTMGSPLAFCSQKS